MPNRLTASSIATIAATDLVRRKPRKRIYHSVATSACPRLASQMMQQSLLPIVHSHKDTRALQTAPPTEGSRTRTSSTFWNTSIDRSILKAQSLKSVFFSHLHSNHAADPLQQPPTADPMPIRRPSPNLPGAYCSILQMRKSVRAVASQNHRTGNQKTKRLVC